MSAIVVLPYSVAGIICFISSLPILLGEMAYNPETCLKDAKEFIKCVFQWQFAIIYIWKETGCTIKKSGIAFLVAICSIFVFPENAMVLFILICLEVVRFFVFMFMKIFATKESGHDAT